jgi:hypothetical protein
VVPLLVVEGNLRGKNSHNSIIIWFWELGAPLVTHCHISVPGPLHIFMQEWDRMRNRRSMMDRYEDFHP